jgi:RNA polymerase sigma-70 factor (ECF subfamily)
MRLLYHGHAAALWRYAMRLTSDRFRSEDLVQETLLRAWEHPEVSDDSERSARAWLFTVARNLIIDESRSSRFRNEVSLPESAEVRGPVGVDEADAAVDRVLIAKACARLSAEHRAVLFRYFYLTWTTAQIAQDLHIPTGTVKSRLRAAKRQLRRSLDEMGVRRCARLSAVGESESPFALQTARFAWCDMRDAVPAGDPPAARLLCDSPLNAESLAEKR